MAGQVLYQGLGGVRASFWFLFDIENSLKIENSFWVRMVAGVKLNAGSFDDFFLFLE
jgi:hypothetical protein